MVGLGQAMLRPKGGLPERLIEVKDIRLEKR